MPQSQAPWIFAALLTVMTGCMKAASPSGTETPFAVDPPTPPLTPSCATPGIDGCGNARALQQSIATMSTLHEAQMAEMEGALSSLQGVLNRPDSTPTANIQASPLSVQDWLDIESTYPAELVVRFEAQRGLAYMGESSVDDMTGALVNLEQIAKAHAMQWQAALSQQPRGLVLPDKVIKERTLSTVTVQLTKATHKFQVPSILGRAYIKRDVAPWAALAAHVITEPGMHYEVLQQHRLPIADAIAISGTGPFSIKERSPYKQKTKVTSAILPTDVCDSLRGELRFVRSSEPVPVRAAFRVANSEGGSK